MSTAATQPPAPSIEKLAYSREETCVVLGGISTVTLWRYVKRGLLHPVAGTNGRLYSKKAVLAFLEKEGA